MATGIFLLAVNRHARRSMAGGGSETIFASASTVSSHQSQDGAALVAQGTIEGGLLTDPQDVAAAGPGAFYVSNGTGGGNFVCARWPAMACCPVSNMLYFNGMSFRVAADDVYGARGLVLTPDGDICWWRA